ncbi:MAG: hypothetical protein ACPGGA_11095, partial [Balneolaceae bacterium]
LGSNPIAQPQELKAIRFQLEKERQNLEAYINLITSVLPGTGLPVHQVMGLAIANADTLRELPYSLMNSKLMPQALTEFTEIADIERCCSTITEWCEQLHSSSIPESSIWNASNIENLSAKKLNEYLGSLQTLVDKFQYLSGQIPPDFAEGLFSLLNHPRSKIIKHIHCLVNTPWLQIIEQKIDELGASLAEENITSLAQDQLIRRSIAQVLDIRQEETIFLHEGMASLLQLKVFCDRYGLSDFSGEIVQSSRLRYENIYFNLTKINELKNILFHEVSPNIEPSYLHYFHFLDGTEIPVTAVRSLIRELGIRGSLDEVKRAKSLIRRKSQIFSSGNTLSHQKLIDIHNIISNAGIFSFLSNEYKSAIDELSNLLLGISNKTPKTIILTKLSDAVALVSDWESLAVSGFVEFSENKAEALLEAILDSVDEINLIVNKTNLSQVESLRLFSWGYLSEFRALLDGAYIEGVNDWQSIEKTTTKVAEELEFIHDTEEHCLDAISLLHGMCITNVDR